MKILSYALVMSALSTVLGAQSANAISQLNYKDYLQKCGGRVYAKCDLKPSPNQRSIYTEALNLAAKTNRKVLITVGADWCAPCVVLDRMLSSSRKEFEKLDRDYVLLKLNADVQETKALITEKFQFKVPAYPTMLVVDPKNEKLNSHLMPAAMTSVDGLINLINLSLAPKSSQASKLPLAWGPTAENVSISYRNHPLVKDYLNALGKEIALDPKTQNHKLPAQIVSVYGETLAIKFYRQGLVYLHSFAYLDAFRSFSKSLSLDNKLYPAYLMIFETGLDLGLYSISDQIQPLVMARSVKPTAPGLRYLQSYADYLEATACESETKDCAALKALGFNENPLQNLIGLALRDASIAEDFDVIGLVGPKLNSVEVFTEVLKKDPNNLAAHHQLVHLNENLSKYKEAVFHAQRFVQIVPQIAHSHHMYGHVLPKVGQWKEAVRRFEIADQVHRRWSQASGIPERIDWHFEHNLNLLAHAYFFGRNLDQAEKTWKERCERTNFQHCAEYIKFLVYRNKGSEASNFLSIVLKKIPQMPSIDQRATISIEFLVEDLAVLDFFVNKASVSEMQKMYKSLNEKKEGFSDMPLLYDLHLFTYGSDGLLKAEDHVTKMMTDGGFDSWSEGIFTAELIQRIALRLGEKGFAANIRLVQESVGFRCK